MTSLRRALRLGVVGLVVFVGAAAALAAYFLYTPPVAIPALGGTLAQHSLALHGRTRTFQTYTPRGLKAGAPLVVVMHGSFQTGATIRKETGYGFDRLADRHGFIVAYPDGYDGHWNGCNIVGDYKANTLDIDDVGFLTQLVDTLIATAGVDRDRVFAAGVSRGGSMALRLAIEAPSHFRAVAAVAANEPARSNFKCTTSRAGTSSVMLMNGTKDPLVPFNGGEVNLLGVFMRRGNVMSSRESGQYFASLNATTTAPTIAERQLADGIAVEDVLWRCLSGVEVELVAIQGGGHGIPQPYRRHARLLGPSPTEPNGPDVIWAFFERQTIIPTAIRPDTTPH